MLKPTEGEPFLVVLRRVMEKVSRTQLVEEKIMEKLLLIFSAFSKTSTDSVNLRFCPDREKPDKT